MERREHELIAARHCFSQEAELGLGFPEVSPLTEIPEQEISLLKETFKHTVQEAISYIQPLTLYTSGYLRAELEDDEIIGPRWGTVSETRLNLIRLQSDFFETVKRFYNAGITLAILQNSPALQSRLVIRLEDSEWLISLRHFVFVLWQVLLEPYVRQCWAKHNRIYFDPEIFEEVFAENIEGYFSELCRN